MSKVSVADALFVALFAAFIVLPNLHFSREDVSLKENRTLAPFKPLIANGKVNRAFRADFEKFYADRFFMRDALIDLNTCLASPFVATGTVLGNERVLLGEEGWLFYRGDNSERNFLNLDYFSEGELQSILAYLKGFKSFCDKRGKRFVFVIAPDKNKVYGEYYPAILQGKKQNPDTASRAFQLVDYIKRNSDVNVIYLWERLTREKEKGDLLYFKNDTHWTQLGSYYGWEELCHALGIELMGVEGFEQTKKEAGDLTNFFPAGTTRDFETLYRVPKVAVQYSREERADEWSWYNAIVTECAGRELNAAFFCDSMSIVPSGLIRYVSNSFAHVTYLRRKNVQEVDLDVLNQADVVVVEQMERGLPGLAALTFPAFD